MIRFDETLIEKDSRIRKINSLFAGVMQTFELGF